MAGLRGSKQLWGTGNTGEAVLTTGLSKYAVIGAQNNVVIYLKNTGSVDGTFTVQCSATTGNAPGLNELDTTASPDYGLIWFDYIGGDNVAIVAGKAVCLDLSPFGPQFVRVKRVDSGASTTVVAFVTSEAD